MIARLLTLLPLVFTAQFPSRQGAGARVPPINVIITGPVDAEDGGSLSPIVTHEQLLADGGYPFHPHGVVDIGNSSTTPLGANETFIGGWADTKDYGAIVVSVNSDQNSAPNGLLFEWSPDANHVDVVESGFFSANRGRGFAIGPRSHYFRVRFVNDGAPQSFFRLNTVLAWPSVQPVIRTIDRDLTTENLAQSTRSVIAVQTSFDAGIGVGVFSNVEGSGTHPGQASIGIVTRPIGPVEVVLDGGIITVTGAVSASQSGPWTVSSLGPLTNAELRASPINAFIDGGQIVATQGGTWTVQQGNAPWTASLGTVDSKTNVMKTGALVTTATTADQVVLIYTVTGGKTFFVQYMDLYVRLTTPGGGNFFFGNMSIESPAGTKLYTADMISPSSGPIRLTFAEPLPIAASTVIRVVCTPGATTSYTWRANVAGFER